MRAIPAGAVAGFGDAGFVIDDTGRMLPCCSITNPARISARRRAASERQVALSIDGFETLVPEGTSVMRAAAIAGIKVPKLCATDSLEAFGSCRVCLVQIEGRKGYPASCTTPVEPGMVVRTQTPELARLRRNVLELYISDHPLDCLTCAANGDCELQDVAGAVGLREVRYGFDGANHLHAEKDQSNPYFSFDPARCIVCSRCVRACEEVQGTYALTVDGRGFASRIAAGMDESFLESDCVSCGACVQACPTATLQEKSVIELGQPEHSVVTTCAYCGVGCAFRAEMRGRHGGADDAAPGWQGQRGTLLRQGALRVRLCDSQGSHHHADDPRQHRSAVARGLVGGSDRVRRRAPQEHSAAIRSQQHRCDHLVALHQRGNVPGAEAGADRIRQQQRRYLRQGLPLSDRLWVENHAWRVSRYAVLQLGRRRPM